MSTVSASVRSAAIYSIMFRYYDGLLRTHHTAEVEDKQGSI